MLNETNRWLQFYAEWQAAIAIFSGTILQMLFLENPNKKIIATIAVSAVFVAVYVAYPALEYMGIDLGGKIATGVFALSAFLSIAFLTMLIAIFNTIVSMLPEAARAVINKYLGG